MKSLLASLLGALVLLAAASLAATEAFAQTGPAPQANPRPKIGLVLSGGGARGAAHVGVLKVLEEMRIPVDYIAGTSMGSIVGGSYATGMPLPEMEKELARIRTVDLFTDTPPRKDIPVRRKQEDREVFFGPEFGFNKWALQLPKGAISGIALEAELRKLVLLKGPRNFDELPIPYRAVATDIVSGLPHVFVSGEVAVAMRASMSIPGAVSPAEIGGNIYVDGGLVDNLPVDVARKMGADVVIAVNLGTPLMTRDQITSIVGVVGQMINILTEQNVRASLASLRPEDILILPELGNFSATDFDNLPKTVPIGEAAARKVADRLARYSVSPEEYAAWKAKREAENPPSGRRIDEIRVEGVNRVNPEVIVSTMETRVGDPVDQDVIDADLRRIYGRGDFEHLSYRVIDEQSRRILAVDATEKSWGPNYLRFGLGLSTDFQGETYFNLLARYRSTWMNKLGGEFRADAQIGRLNQLAGEFYQPLVPNAYFFVAPNASVQSYPINLFSDGVKIAQYNVRSAQAGLDLGSQFAVFSSRAARPSSRARSPASSTSTRSTACASRGRATWARPASTRPARCWVPTISTRNGISISSARPAPADMRSRSASKPAARSDRVLSRSTTSSSGAASCRCPATASARSCRSNCNSRGSSTPISLPTFRCSKACTSVRPRRLRTSRRRRFPAGPADS